LKSFEWVANLFELGEWSYKKLITMLIIHHVCGCPKITFFSIFERLWAFGQVGEIETTITFKKDMEVSVF
jgi:hypothetical protein